MTILADDLVADKAVGAGVAGSRPPTIATRPKLALAIVDRTGVG
jgi:hypothetical protein